MGVSDLVERFPLLHISPSAPNDKGYISQGSLRLLPLQRGECGLYRVVLTELRLDVVINVLQFFLQVVNQLPQRSIGSVSDFIPLKGTKVVIRGLCGQLLDTLEGWMVR